jgi:hypothetical protein
MKIRRQIRHFNHKCACRVRQLHNARDHYRRRFNGCLRRAVRGRSAFITGPLIMQVYAAAEKRAEAGVPGARRSCACWGNKRGATDV